MTRIEKGERAALDHDKIVIVVDYDDRDLAVEVVGLDDAGQGSDSHYTVSREHPKTPENAIVMTPGENTTIFDIDLQALPASIAKIIVTATHDYKLLTQCDPLVVTVDDVIFNAGACLTSEDSASLVEIARYNNGWRLMATAQNLSRHLNPANQAPYPIPLAQQIVTLSQAQSVDLSQKNADFDDINVTLKWRLKADDQPIDLDLGCLFETQRGERGVIQALGSSFGSYDRSPYIKLESDDRSGNGSKGETIRIKGAHFKDLKRVAFYAMIYDGAPDWATTDAVVSIKTHGLPLIDVPINAGEQRLCGVVILDNHDGQIRITSHNRYYKNQQQYAETPEVSIDLVWHVGHKD